MKVVFLTNTQTCMLRVSDTIYSLPSPFGKKLKIYYVVYLICIVVKYAVIYIYRRL